MFVSVQSSFLTWIFFLKSKHFFPVFVKTIKFNYNQSCKLVINSVIVDIKKCSSLTEIGFQWYVRPSNENSSKPIQTCSPYEN